MILLIFASSFAQLGLGDILIPGTGRTAIIRSPILNDHSFNPASFSDKIYTEFTSKITFSSSRQFTPTVSSIGLSIPAMKKINIGMGVDMLYNQNFSYTFPEDTNEWDTYTQKITRIGNILRYFGFLSFKSGKMRLGAMYGYLHGNSEYRWTIDFTRYRDIHDTTFTEYKGLTYSGGIAYTFDRIQIGLFGEKVYLEGQFTHYNICAGISYKTGDIEILFSLFNLNPQIGIIWNEISLGGGYTNWGDEHVLEKHAGLSYTHKLKDNPFTFFFMLRHLEDTGTGYGLEDTEYCAGFSFEFNE